MEYRSQTQWNEVYQGRFLSNQLGLLQKRYKRDFKLSHSQFMQLLEMLKPFIKKKGYTLERCNSNNKSIGGGNP